MFTLYGLYTVFVFATLGMFLVQSRNVHSELSKRSVLLVTLQAIGAFIVGTVGLVCSAVIYWSCFFKLWIFSLGMTLLMTTILARAVQLIVISRIHNLNSQLVRNNPQFMENVKGKLEHRLTLPELKKHRSIREDGGFIDKQMLSDAIKESKAMMDPNKRDAVLRELARYIKLQPYVTDRSMVIYIACAMAFTSLLTLIVTVTNKDYSLSPMSVVCPLNWGFIPIYVIGTTYLVIVCPVLLAMTWGLKDAYGIRTDLIICDTAGIVSDLMMLIWEVKFKHWNDRWSDMFFVWDAVLLIHIFSVVLPLWRSIKHLRNVNKHLRSETPTTASTVTLMNGQPADHVPIASAAGIGPVSSDIEKVIRQRGNSKFRRGFVEILNDPQLYAQFKDFASSCFCSELISFIDEYQTLKALTLIALGQKAYSTKPVFRPTSTPLMQSPISAVFVIPEDSNHSDSIPNLPLNINLSKLHNNATMGILEAAKEIYPDRGFNHATMFPPALMDALVMIFSNYINSSSPTAVNVPQIMIRRIQEKLKKKQLYLTILDEVKDEVLYLLYVNVFTRFST
ncbi:hypothetical protein GGI12_004429 [Dipsacomyces acuminosporus]|nr:hypothetical protein GGI12_004429 [Dipsacomyces acuminosporus]